MVATLKRAIVQQADQRNDKMKDHYSQAEPDKAVQSLELNLSADGWRLEVIGVPDFPDRPDLPLFTPRFQKERCLP